VIASLAAVFGRSALDPLYTHGVHWFALVVVLIKVVVGFAALSGAVIMMIWFERKLISDMQARIGPNRAGPWGLLQTLADGIKLIFKENLLPDNADRFVYKVAAYVSLVPVVLMFAVIPVGGEVTVAGHTFELQVADPPVGILFVLAMSSLSVYGVMLAGWSSGSKYPLLGSVRASAQMISYEAALGLIVVLAVLLTGSSTDLVGSLSTRAIVESQSHTFFVSWNVIRTGIVPFVIFLIAITAETQRPPFDFAEADTELVGGFNTEYSSFRFAMFYMAEFMGMIVMSAVIVTLFFGGPDGPTPHVFFLSWVVPILWFLGKLFLFLFIYVWFRAALPRLRYDQLMNLGWKVLIPLSLAWSLVVAAAIVGKWWFVGVVVALLAGGALVARALYVGRGRGEAFAGSTLPAAGTPPVLPGSPRPPAGDVR
jgi:NADH-quinone oxidoreductase subunit H